MTNITVQDLKGDILSFTLREDIEISDVKEVIGLHFDIKEERIMISKLEDDEIIVCKDYFEVSSGDHFYLYINDIPRYKMIYNMETFQIDHSSGETVMIFEKNKNKWLEVDMRRHLHSNQPYILEIKSDNESIPMIIESLRSKYNELNQLWIYDNEIKRTMSEEDNVIHYPLENQSVYLFEKLMEQSENFNYLIQEFITHYKIYLNNKLLKIEIIF